jgi:hypothetical protein
MVFAREATPQVKALIKKLDATAAKNDDLNSCVVFLTDASGMEKKLQAMTDEAGLKKLVVALDENPAGPELYKLSREADVTVLLYNERKVKSNHTFKKGELTEAAVEKIAGEAGKLTK